MINPRRLLFVLVIFFGTTLGSFGQGINKNIWIFGDCTPTGRTILNFDPIDNEANVIALDPTSIGGNQPLEENTIATAIDQTSGKLLFYTNGALFFNGNHESDGTNLDGDETIPQSVAIAVGSFDQDPLVTDNYFILYRTPGTKNLGFQQLEYDETLGVRIVGGPNNTFKSNIGSAIELVDKAKPNIGNTSYLFYYDISGGSLHSLLIDGVTPSAWIDTSFPIPLVGDPVSIRFNEASNQVAVVTSTGEVAFVKFDRATGSFDPTSIILTSLPTPTAQPKAITFDPTGTKSYFTIGNELYQIDLSIPSTSPSPVLVAGITGVQEIFDVQLAPNGQVYFLYTPIGSTEVKLGAIETPSVVATDPVFVVDMDPFPSVNFCGKMFPNFSTTVYITPTVDIILPSLPASGEFCADNPIQLVSKITPANLVPVSYEWKITSSGPPTPTSGPAPNLGVAHLILAGQGTLTVDLTVKFKDHPDRIALSQTVNFSTTPVDRKSVV
jgi:hypothetical protein